jgi:uncharacterized protein YdiU (UPF0061 family)
MTMSKRTFGWNFDNSYARLPDFFYQFQTPIEVRKPELVLFNDKLARSLELDGDDLQQNGRFETFAGNQVPIGAQPLAQAYAGHQFGHFTMLGDGRAILLGEHVTSSGQRFDIQLKGAGRTQYSRRGDGRAALGPMLREYLISEAMHALGIPTTRSLAVATTGEVVYRETVLAGAVLTRVASSHIRVGTFEYAASMGTIEHLKSLADYTIHRHFPELFEQDQPYLGLLKRVMDVQAKLIASWQLVGFVHGVMNTDNMAISGETIDYGPCAFLDTYHSQTVFSSIDTYGRYAYGNQPKIASWNLARFAETLLPLINEDQQTAVSIAQDALALFPGLFQSYWLSGMRHKLGMLDKEEHDQKLIEQLLDLMKTYHADYTNTFVGLTTESYERQFLFETDEFQQWRKKWEERLLRSGLDLFEIHKKMKSVNPRLIPRNQLVEEALSAAVEHADFSYMHNFLEAVSKPYEYSVEIAGKYTETQHSGKPYRTFCGT